MWLCNPWCDTRDFRAMYNRVIGYGPNMASESTVPNTELSEPYLPFLTEFWGESSVSSSWPTSGVQKRTHPAFCSAELTEFAQRLSKLSLPKQYHPPPPPKSMQSTVKYSGICSGQVRPRQGTEICNFGAPSPLEALHWIFCFFSSILCAI